MATTIGSGSKNKKASPTVPRRGWQKFNHGRDFMKKAIAIKRNMVGSEEYCRIYTELMQRLKDLFSQGYMLLTVVGVIWSLAATSLGMFLKAELITLSGDFVLLSVGFSLVIVVLFGLPAILAFPFAVKHHDNLRAVASLSAYVKAFYEAPSMSASAENKDGFLGWETLHCDAGLSRTRFFNFEYIISSLISDFLSLSFGIVTVVNIIKANLVYEHTVISVVFFTLALVYEAVVIFLTVHIFRYSRTIFYARLYSEQYLEIYLKEAMETKRISEKQAEAYTEYYKSVLHRDNDLSRILEYDKKILKKRMKKENVERNMSRKTSTKIKKLADCIKSLEEEKECLFGKKSGT